MAAVSARWREKDSADTMAERKARRSVAESAAPSELLMASVSAMALGEEKALHSDAYLARESAKDLDWGTVIERALKLAQG